MPEERIFDFDLATEVDRYFDDASLAHGAQPHIIILMGGPAAGKTTIRKQRYTIGYVVVDASEVFLSLSRGEDFDFPGPFEDMMNLIGPLIADRAIQERRHIVTELIGADFEPTKALIDAMVAIGYHIDFQMITCDLDEAQRRNLNREDNSISAYYTEPYQRAWLQEAATSALDTE